MAMASTYVFLGLPVHVVLPALLLLGTILILIADIGSRMLGRNERRREVRERAARRRDRKEPYGG